MSAAVLSLQLTIFLLVIVGFLVRRFGLVGEQGQKNLNDLVLNVILPCNIFMAFLSGSADKIFGEYGFVLLISLGIQILCVFYGKIVFRKEPEPKRKCLEYATICSNSGFLGNPVAEGMYGAEGLILASVYLIPLRIMMWSVGLPIFTGVKDRKLLTKKILTHPCIIACALGIIFMAAGWTLPQSLMKTLSSLGTCNTAMSMLVIGMILSKIDLRHLWDPVVLKYSLHRLVILPALVLLLCYFLPISKTAMNVCVILAAMPAGATTSILAEKYGTEPEFCTKLVIISTLLSLPSIALWSILLQVI